MILKSKNMENFSITQINALKYLIFMSKDASPETKKICFALIDASDGFTKPVYFTVDMKNNSFGTHGMVSCNGSTHLSEILNAMGTDFHFSTHGGFFVSEGNFLAAIKPGDKNTLTVWLSKNWYDKKATEITKEEVEKVEVKDTLYDLD